MGAAGKSLVSQGKSKIWAYLFRERLEYKFPQRFPSIIKLDIDENLEKIDGKEQPPHM